MSHDCPNCAKLEEQIVGLKLSLKRLREQYDRVYNGATLAARYKKQRDNALQDYKDLMERIYAAKKRPA